MYNTREMKDRADSNIENEVKEQRLETRNLISEI